MKFFVVFCAIVVMAQALSSDTIEKIKIIKQKCVKDKNVPPTHIDKIMKGDHNIPNDATMNSFAYCVFTEMEVIDDSGIVVKDKIMEVIDNDHKDMVEKTLDGCITETGKITEQNAFGFCQCMHKNLDITSF